MAAPPPRRAPTRRAAPGRSGRASSADPAGEDAGDPPFTVPRRRTAKLHPVAAIALFGSPLVLAIVIAVLYVNKQSAAPSPTPAEADDNIAYEGIKEKIAVARRLYLAAMEERESDSGEFAAKVSEALDYVVTVIDEFDALFDPYRDEEGELPSDLGYYGKDRQTLQTMYYDLQRSSGF